MTDQYKLQTRIQLAGPHRHEIASIIREAMRETCNISTTMKEFETTLLLTEKEKK